MCEHSSRITNDCVDYQHSVNQNKAHTIHLTFVKLVIKSGMLAKRVPNGSMPTRRGVRMGTLKSEMCTCITHSGPVAHSAGNCAMYSAHIVSLCCSGVSHASGGCHSLYVTPSGINGHMAFGIALAIPNSSTHALRQFFWSVFLRWYAFCATRAEMRPALAKFCARTRACHAGPYVGWSGRWSAFSDSCASADLLT